MKRLLAGLLLALAACGETYLPSELDDDGGSASDAATASADGSQSEPDSDAALPARDAGSEQARDAGTLADASVTADAGHHADAGNRPDASVDAGACHYTSAAAVSDDLLPGETQAGRSEATAVNGFSDEYLYDQTDYIKVGVRREWGGSIVFFGLDDDAAGVNATNTIDGNDTGREVQVAFYDPDRHMQNCAWNASCRTAASTCPSSITYLGWNPVQGGNRCNNGSGVDSVSNSNGLLRIVTTPLFWNPNWDFSDCTTSGCSDSSLARRRSDVRVTQSLRFVRKHVVELRYQVENLAAVDHASTDQEMPTLYTANGRGGPDLWRLIDASGTQVPIDTPAGNADGFYYENFDSPASWVSMQNADSTYGVGILYENGLRAFQGWQQRALPFNNVRARFAFGIPSRGTVNARAYLILGGFGTVSAEANWLLGHLPPFGHLDQPDGSTALSGRVTIGGWALDNRGVTSVSARIDESTTVPLTYGGSRPDVCKVWPGYPSCSNVGYNGTFDVSSLSRGCPHLLEIVATDVDGNSRVIARRLISVAD